MARESRSEQPAVTAPPRPSLSPPNPPPYVWTCDAIAYIWWLEQQLESCEAARERWEATAEHRQAQLERMHRRVQFLEEENAAAARAITGLEQRVATLEAAFEQALSDWGENEPAYPLKPED